MRRETLEKLGRWVLGLVLIWFALVMVVAIFIVLTNPA